MALVPGQGCQARGSQRAPGHSSAGPVGAAQDLLGPSAVVTRGRCWCQGGQCPWGAGVRVPRWKGPQRAPPRPAPWQMGPPSRQRSTSIPSNVARGWMCSPLLGTAQAAASDEVQTAVKSHHPAAPLASGQPRSGHPSCRGAWERSLGWSRGEAQAGSTLSTDGEAEPTAPPRPPACGTGCPHLGRPLPVTAPLIWTLPVQTVPASSTMFLPFPQGPGHRGLCLCQLQLR